MSDTSEVPAPPATPDEPTPVVTTASTTAAPETASTPASGASAEDETVTDSTTPETTSEDSDEDSTETAPEVVNTADGQHVVMPDGKKVYTRHHAYPISNAEWAQYEKTHAGDQERYPYVPGDKEYSPHSDPHIPNSKLANDIEQEIASFASRVLKGPNAPVSRIWNAVRGIYDGEVDQLIRTGGSTGKVVE
jgi:hypothetical protein